MSDEEFGGRIADIIKAGDERREWQAAVEARFSRIEATLEAVDQRIAKLEELKAQ